MGGRFWSAWVDCCSQYKDATQKYLEQIDLIHQVVAKYPDHLMWADSADGIEAAWAAGKMASLIGVESGHAIGSSLPALRSLYALGARYMTLTHVCNTPWADAAQVDEGSLPARAHGLTQFGRRVVHEMNRLGMMVDLSHVSVETMQQAIQASLAPVIFSHSSARAVTDHVRNVPDIVLKMVAKNGGLVMVNLYSGFVKAGGINATVYDVVNHVNHIRAVAGVDHVGIGSNHNGGQETPLGMEDASKFPNLFAALIEDGRFAWSDEDLGKLASGNLLRVMREVEAVRDVMAAGGVMADNTWIPAADLGNDTACSTDYVTLDE